MNIILCADNRIRELSNMLSEFGDVVVMEYCPNGLSRLGYYLQDKSPCDLLAVAVAGAAGMNLCDRGRKSGRFPIVWISEQAEFAPQAARMGVDCFLAEPVTNKDLITAVKRLI